MVEVTPHVEFTCVWRYDASGFIKETLEEAFLRVSGSPLSIYFGISVLLKIDSCGNQLWIYPNSFAVLHPFGDVNNSAIYRVEIKLGLDVKP